MNTSDLQQWSTAHNASAAEFKDKSAIVRADDRRLNLFQKLWSLYFSAVRSAKLQEEFLNEWAGVDVDMKDHELRSSLIGIVHTSLDIHDSIETIYELVASEKGLRNATLIGAPLNALRGVGIRIQEFSDILADSLDLTLDDSLKEALEELKNGETSRI